MKKTFYPLLVVLMTCLPALTMAAEQKQLSQEELDAKAMAEMFPENAPSEKTVYQADPAAHQYRRKLGRDPCCSQYF